MVERSTGVGYPPGDWNYGDVFGRFSNMGKMATRRVGVGGRAGDEGGGVGGGEEGCDSQTMSLGWTDLRG